MRSIRSPYSLIFAICGLLPASYVPAQARNTASLPGNPERVFPARDRSMYPVSSSCNRDDEAQDQSQTSAQKDSPQQKPPSQNSVSSDQPQQTKRILGIIPNFRSVSTDEILPPMTVQEKFMTATNDSFDYSSIFIPVALAGYGLGTNATPELGQGAAGYGRYLWRSAVDQTSEN